MAMLGALHIVHELLTMRLIKSFDMNEFKRRIKPLENKLDRYCQVKKINKKIKLV
jgi:hypothetical protein